MYQFISIGCFIQKYQLVYYKSIFANQLYHKTALQFTYDQLIYSSYWLLLLNFVYPEIFRYKVGICLHIMGNSESSSPDEGYENFSHQPPSFGGYTVDTGYQPQISEHATTSTHTNHHHHHHNDNPTNAGALINTSNTKKQHPSFIDDNFNSLDEVSFLYPYIKCNCIDSYVLQTWLHYVGFRDKLFLYMEK